ncbi:MAG: glycoside hydrolase family 25 protein [Arenimonas sp.]
MTTRIKTIIGLILLLNILFVGTLVYELLKTGAVRLNYPDKKEFPVRGIDVSHHQGLIDWKKIAQQDVRFAYIKATEGEDFLDEDFKHNWASAKDVGILPGAYHYFTLCKTGYEQANNFLSRIGTPSSKSLPPAVDLEFGGNCKARPSPEELRKELKVFIDLVEQAWGCRVVLYSTPDFYPVYLQNYFLQNPLWIRDLYGQPDTGRYREWQFWQYANRGKLDGIKGFVDLNVSSGDQKQFNQLLNCSGA